MRHDFLFLCKVYCITLNKKNKKLHVYKKSAFLCTKYGERKKKEPEKFRPILCRKIHYGVSKICSSQRMKLKCKRKEKDKLFPSFLLTKFYVTQEACHFFSQVLLILSQKHFSLSFFYFCYTKNFVFYVVAGAIVKSVRNC